MGAETRSRIRYRRCHTQRLHFESLWVWQIIALHSCHGFWEDSTLVRRRGMSSNKWWWRFELSKQDFGHSLQARGTVVGIILNTMKLRQTTDHHLLLRVFADLWLTGDNPTNLSPATAPWCKSCCHLWQSTRFITTNWINDKPWPNQLPDKTCIRTQSTG